ncbi:MAG: YopX family protein [Eubacteriales bacterium]|nr:YopX family protein [Eubacteriales bacterium]
MREILFRGKRYDTGEWVYGSFLPDIYGARFPAILNNAEYDDGNNIVHDFYFVCRTTVGLYTLLYDKNGKRIFEGDIIRIKTDCFSMRGVVEFDDASLIVTDGEITECLWYNPSEMEVIGNIHDNPELLEGGGH